MKIRQQYCIDGEYHYYDEPLLSVTNRAFRYGDAVFESMFVTSKQVPLLEKHWRRLTKALNYWEMMLPGDVTQARIAREIIRLCNKNRLFQGARARLMVFRKGEGLYTPETDEASYILEVTHFAVEEFTLNERGYRLGIYEAESHQATLASAFKSAQCLLSIKAGIYKKSQGYDEVLLLSSEKNIVEATAYNIFALKGQTLLTPHLASGCVAGVMRESILELANENGFHAEQIEKMTLKTLEDAEEVFLTNAVVGLRWVLALGEKRYFSTQSRKLVALLNNKWIENGK